MSARISRRTGGNTPVETPYPRTTKNHPSMDSLFRKEINDVFLFYARLGRSSLERAGAGNAAQAASPPLPSRRHMLEHVFPGLLVHHRLERKPVLQRLRARRRGAGVDFVVEALEIREL